MNIIEPKTLFIIYLTIAGVCLILMSSLWVQNRKRTPEIVFWLIDYALQFAGIFFVAFRDIFPPFFSLIAGELCIIGGTVILYIGLGHFARKSGAQIHNFAMLVIFTMLQIWFTYIDPGLTAVNICVSVSLIFISVQICWLMLSRAGASLRQFRLTGIIFAGYTITSAVYLTANIIMPRGNDLLQMSAVNSFIILSYLLLYVLLTFSLSLMVNSRLLADLEQELSSHRVIEEELGNSEDKFKKAFQISPDAIAISRLEDGIIIEVNDTFQYVTGHTKEDAVGKSTRSLRIWENENEYEEVAAELRAGKAVSGRLYRFRKKNGEIITGLFSTQTILLAGGKCILSSISDISRHLQTEEELRSHRRFLYEIIEHSGALICIKDLEGRYDLVNRAWERVTGLNRGEALGRTDEELFSKNDAETFRKNDIDVLDTGKSIEVEEELSRDDGKHFFISIKFPLISDAGAVSGVCSMATEITERKRAEEQIRHLATHDALTNLPGLRLSKDRLAMALSQTRRQKNSIAVMFADLDNFKGVNDALGHEAGDFVLTEVAARLLSCVRETDTVARIGGDEFLIIITGLNNADKSAMIAQKMINIVSQPFQYRGQDAHVGMSIGIAIVPDHGEEMNTLIRLADAAMYTIKKSGKNGYCFVNGETAGKI